MGANYKVSDADRLDIGYLHIVMKDASLNLSHPIVDSQTTITRGLSGGYDSDVDVLSMQYTHAF